MLSESDLKWCQKLFATLGNARNRDKSMFFNGPVIEALPPGDWEAYRGVVAEPRDLRTMSEDLAAGKYSSVDDFIADAILCFDNAILFNKQRFPHVAGAAESLKKVVKTEVAKYRKTVEAAAVKASAAAAAAAKKVEPMIFIPQCTQLLGVLSAMDDTFLFREPVDVTQFVDYPLRVDHPMDFGTIRGRLSDGKMAGPGEFALLVRRVLSNCLIYNYQLRGELGSVVKAIRARAREILTSFEDSWRVKFPGVAPMFFRAHECLSVLEEVLKVPSVGPNNQAADNFMNPIQKYYGGVFPAGYLDVISTPMDLATVTTNVVEAQYKTPVDFKRDMLLIFSNCEKWLHTDKAYYDTVMEQDAKALRKKFLATFDSIVGQSSSAAAASKRKAAIEESAPPVAAAPAPVLKKKAKAPAAPLPPVQAAPTAAPAAVVTVKPTKIILKDQYTFCVEEVKEHFIEAKLGKVYTADFFLKAVDPTKYAGYADLVLHPMCLAMVEKKIRADRYRTLGDIMKDIYLIRHNTYVYNTGGAGLEIRILADHFVNNFSFLLTLVATYILRMQSSIEPGTPATVKSSIEAAASAVSADVQLLAQVYHGADDDAAGKPAVAPADIYASIPDEFFKQPMPDGITAEYERPNPPSPEILSALHSFFKYDPMTLALVKLQETAKPTPATAKPTPASQPTPTKVVAKREVCVPAPIVEAPIMEIEEPPPVRGGKIGGKGGKKRRREEELAAAPEEIPLDTPHAKPADLDDQMNIIVSVARPPSEWELSCFDILKKVQKHDFVDISRPAKGGNIVGNFVAPVVELYPEVAEAYLDLIKNPMDLTIIGQRLEDHAFLDCEDFYENMILVFQNAIDYNQPHMEDGEYAQKLVPRCKHMIKYIKWLCLELLPTADDTDVAEPESLGVLRKSIVLAERQARLDALRNRPIDNQKDCMVLIKKFDHKKTAKEYSFFAVPVSLKDVPNYSTFVRRPMDFSTIKEKIESWMYPSYMAFIEDIQLIFSNAKKFNSAFKDSDAFSQLIYNAATMFEERLEDVLHTEFTIDVLEKLCWNDIRLAEDEKLRLEYAQQMEKQRAEDNEFRDKEAARLKALDTAFAIDQDRELKRTHALDGLLHSGGLSDTARKTIGLFSDRALSLPTVEEREEGMTEVVRRRNNLFESTWSNWAKGSSGAQSMSASNSVGDIRHPSFDGLLLSPQRLRGSASFGKLSNIDTEDDSLSSTLHHSVSADMFSPTSHELLRPNGNGRLQLPIKKISSLGAKRATSKSRLKDTLVALPCFTDTDDCCIAEPELPMSAAESTHGGPTNTIESAGTPMEVETEEPEHNNEVVAVHNVDEKNIIGVKIQKRCIPGSNQAGCFVVVVEYILTTGLSFCRILTPRTFSTAGSGQIEVSETGSVGRASYGLSKDAEDVRVNIIGSADRKKTSEMSLGSAVSSALNCDVDLQPHNSCVDNYPCVIGLGGYENGVEYVVQPFICRLEGSRTNGCSLRTPDKLEDELLFRPYSRKVSEIRDQVSVVNCEERLDHQCQNFMFGGLTDVTFKYCHNLDCMISLGYDCIDAAVILNKQCLVSHGYLQHWLLVGERVDVSVEFRGQELMFPCGEGCR